MAGLKQFISSFVKRYLEEPGFGSRDEDAEWARFMSGQIKGVGNVVVSRGNTSPQYNPLSFESFAKEGFSKNELVYSAIMALIDAFAELELCVKDADDDFIEGSNIVEVLKRPNPFTSWYRLVEITFMHLYVGGNAFWEKWRAGNRVAEIWPLRPDRVSIVPSREDFIAGYLYEVGGEKYPIDARDIVHFKFPHPTDPYWGMSPLRPASRRIDTDNEATDFVKSMLQNGAIPGVVVGTDDALDDDVTRKLRAAWHARFGKDKRGDVAFMQKGMTVQPIGYDMNQLAMADLTQISETRILQCLRVPPIVVASYVGLQNATYSNAEQFVSYFYATTITSLSNRISSEIMLGFDEEERFVDRGHRPCFETSGVAALASERKEAQEQAVKAGQAGFLKRNEVRAILGYEADEDGDVYVVGRGVAILQPGEDPDGEGIGVEGEEPDAPANALPEPEEPEAKARGGRKAVGLEVVGDVLGKVAIARSMESDMIAAVKDVFSKWKSQVRGILDDHDGPIVTKAKGGAKALQNDIEQALTQVIESWQTEAQEGTAPVLRTLAFAAGTAAAGEFGISFELQNPEFDQFVDSYSFKFAAKIAETAGDDVREIMQRARADSLTEDQIRKALAEKYEAWEGYRADRIARTEIIRASNKSAVEVYKAAGVEVVEWVTSDDPCPYCRALSGKRATIGENFLGLGEYHFGVDTSGEPVPAMRVNYEAIDVPPLHPQCYCVLKPIVEP